MGSIDDESISAPDWLNEEFLQGLIRHNYKNNQIVLQDMTIKNAVGKGENYLSRMLKVEAKYSQNGDTKRKYLIFKTFPAGELLQQLVRKNGIFAREISVYYELLPQVESRYAAVTGQKITPVGPCSLFSERDDAVIMEDLTAHGYRVQDRHVRLDLEHATAVMKTLGRFHALTRTIVNSDSPLKEKFDDHMFGETQKVEAGEWVGKTLRNIADIVRKWEKYEQFGEKLHGVSSTAVEKISEQTKPENSAFPVIVHGDCWVNNIMFHYDSEHKVDDVRLVDFQMCRISSPALDLLYLLYTSVQSEIRKEHWLDLIREYLKSLNETLNSLQRLNDVLTEDQLLEEISKQQFFAFIMSTVALPAVLGNPEDAPDLSKITEENKDTLSMTAMYSSPRFRRAYEDLVHHFETVGVV